MNIFRFLDNESLINCKNVDKSWGNFIEYYWSNLFVEFEWVKWNKYLSNCNLKDSKLNKWKKLCEVSNKNGYFFQVELRGRFLLCKFISRYPKLVKRCFFYEHIRNIKKNTMVTTATIPAEFALDGLMHHLVVVKSNNTSVDDQNIFIIDYTNLNDIVVYPRNGVNLVETILQLPSFDQSITKMMPQITTGSVFQVKGTSFIIDESQEIEFVKLPKRSLLQMDHFLNDSVKKRLFHCGRFMSYVENRKLLKIIDLVSPNEHFMKIASTFEYCYLLCSRDLSPHHFLVLLGEECANQQPKLNFKKYIVDTKRSLYRSLTYQELEEQQDSSFVWHSRVEYYSETKSRIYYQSFGVCKIIDIDLEKLTIVTKGMIPIY